MKQFSLLQPLLAAWLVSGLVSTMVHAAAPNTDLPLMPYPAHVQQLPGALALSPAFTIAVAGADSAALQPVLANWINRLHAQTGLVFPSPFVANTDKATLRIEVAQAATDAWPSPDMDESYQLTVQNDGITLKAHQRYGVLRGLETLLQLVQVSRNGEQITHVVIDDAPRFAWRGLLLDVSRHFIPVQDVKRQIDGMAAARLNVLHWHLSDDQGWRIESLRYPKLQQLASDGQFYTQAQIRDVVAYAAQRGIRVVPEVDMPGHATAIAVAYPELASAPGPYQIERGWGVFKPTLDPTREETYQFIDGLLSELTGLFPDPYFHIGGDEVDPNQWNHNPAIQDFMQQHHLTDARALQAYFNGRLQKMLEQHQRHMVGWDEIHHPDLPKSVVIQSWQGPDSLAQTSAEGYPGLLSTGFYLDQPQATAYHYRNELIPSATRLDDSLHASDTAQSWYFVIPRKKGLAIKGSFTLIQDPAKHWRGYVDFNGKSRRLVRDIVWRGQQVTFWLDTWMGETRPVLTLAGDSASGYFLIGNTAFATTAERAPGNVPPSGTLPPTLDAAGAANIKGGEAALWTEIVNPQSLDLRVWPRTFAIAERLWSPATLTDEASMYARLKAMDRWSTLSAGLQQHTEMDNALLRLAGTAEVEPLRILAEPVEQAQYYSRLYEKYGARNYTSAEQLNRFADALPAESFAVHDLQQAVDVLARNHNDLAALAAVTSRLQRWKGNTPAVMKVIDGNATLAPLRPVAEYVDQVSTLGLALLNHLHTGKALTGKERLQASALLQNALTVRDEVVVGAANPVRSLLWMTP